MPQLLCNPFERPLTMRLDSRRIGLEKGRARLHRVWLAVLSLPCSETGSLFERLIDLTILVAPARSIPMGNSGVWTALKPVASSTAPS